MATQTRTMNRYAQFYAQHQWSVLPLHYPKDASCSCGKADCRSPAKHPMNTKGLTEATCDPVTIDGWWRKWPDANIGIVVPEGYVIVDVDGPDGIASIQTAGYELPDTAMSETGRGFHHIYTSNGHAFRPTAGLLEKVDLRAPGGYIVAPPSIHITGKTYKWTRKLTDGVVEVPVWVWELYSKRTAQPEAGASDKFDSAKVLEGVPEGRRDSELFRFASKLRYASIPFSTAVELVLRAAAACIPPFPDAAAKEKVERVYQKYKPSVDVGGTPLSVIMAGDDAVTVKVQSVQGPVEFRFSEMIVGLREIEAEMEIRHLMAGTTSDPYIQRLNLVSVSARDSCRRELDSIFGKDCSWGKLLSAACSAARTAYLEFDRAIAVSSIASPSSVAYVVQTLIPENGATILFGAGSAGKTFLGIGISIAISNGEPFQSFTCQQRNVLFIDYETGPETFGLRVARVMRGLDRTQDEARGLFYWESGGIPLTEQVEGIKLCCRRNNIGFLVIDHAAAACGIEPEKAEAALKFYRALARLKLPALVLAHVTGEGEQNPGTVRKPFGSIMWANGARRTWFIQRQQEQESDEIEIGMFCRKINDGRYPADLGFRIIFEGEGGPIYIEKAELRDNPELEESRTLQQRIWDILDSPLSLEDIAEKLDIKQNTAKMTLNRYRKRFVRVDEGQKGKTAIWARLTYSAPYSE